MISSAIWAAVANEGQNSPGFALLTLWGVPSASGPCIPFKALVGACKMAGVGKMAGVTADPVGRHRSLVALHDH